MTGVALSYTDLFYKLVAVLAVVGVYLSAGRLRIEDRLPIRCFLSFAAGISVAYVFVHILPELDELQEYFIAASGRRVPDFILHIKTYMWALLGLVVFYGLQLAASRNSSKDDGAHREMFLVHIALYALYSAIIGLMIIDAHISGLTSLILISIALAMHFFVIDHSLRREYRQMYDSIGRWILSIAVLCGWVSEW